MAVPLDDENPRPVRQLLEQNAAEDPEKIVVSFEDGTDWTRRFALETASAAAHEMRRAGVVQGDHVAIAFPNGEDFFRALWGAQLLGAVVVPVNTAYVGAILERLLHLAKPKIMVGERAFISRLEGLSVPRPTLMIGTDLLGTDVSTPVLERPVEGWDTNAMCLTSGTTGPSKLPRMSYAHTLSGGNLLMKNWGANRDDTYLADMALFHASGMYFVHSALDCGMRIAVRSRPNLSQYWEVAKETGATVSMLMSTMVTYLEAKPPRPAEKEHDLRLALVVPAPENLERFQERFHIENVHISWASSELPAATCRWPGQKAAPGYCGQVRPGFEVRLVDENDNEVPLGEPGEAMVRSDKPWLIATEYVGDPAATAGTWRNGWFHSGDMLRRDAEGNFFFVDRSKDAIRRRGENISSFEVEKALLVFPGISEAACVPERSGVEVEDEVKAWLVPVEGVEVDLPKLLEHCVEQLPYYMVPRYFEVVTELPKTPTLKIQKYELRARGNSAATWDRTQNGYEVTRFGLQRLESTDA